MQIVVWSPRAFSKY